MHKVICFLFFVASSALAQTNSFPLYSSGAYSGGSGDYTGITSPQLKLQATSGYVRVPHLSSNSLISTVYNYETGKYVFWGEPSDAGLYLFRGRSLIVEGGNLGIGTTNPSTRLAVVGAQATEESVVNVTNAADQDFAVRLSAVGAAVKRTWIGPSTSTRFSLGVGIGNEQLTIVSGGNVGIGTTAPEAKLDIRGGILAKNNNGNQLSMQTNSQRWDFDVDESMGNALRLRNMTAGSVPLVIGTTGNVGVGTVTPRGKFDVDGPGDIYLNDDPVKGAGQNIFLPGHIFISPHTSASGIAFLQARRADNSGTTSLRIRTWNSGSLTDAMHIEGNGNIGVGTVTPGSYKLAVEGKIGAREVNVTTNAWSDYVFNADYKLRPLAEVQQYIEENHHLPEVPSEKEVLANGQNLGEMNAILLKKIEELTLYQIEANKKIEALQEELKKLTKP